MLLFFQTESGYDYLEIKNGEDVRSAKLGKFSGSTLPTKIKSTGNQLFVRFYSDSSTQRKGFFAFVMKGKK